MTQHLQTVCLRLHMMIIYGDGANDNRHLPSTEASLDELLMGEGGRADEASLSKVNIR